MDTLISKVKIANLIHCSKSTGMTNILMISEFPVRGMVLKLSQVLLERGHAVFKRFIPMVTSMYIAIFPTIQSH